MAAVSRWLLVCVQWNDVGKDSRVPPDQQEQIAARFDLYDSDRLDGAVDSKVTHTHSN